MCGVSDADCAENGETARSLALHISGLLSSSGLRSRLHAGRLRGESVCHPYRAEESMRPCSSIDTKGGMSKIR